MNVGESLTQVEIDSAWILWQALMEHMETLWTRYEEPFSERMQWQQAWDEEQDLSWLSDLSDDDIPF